ncbi:Putative Zn-dependent protease, contains TPR repeats [Burkholderia pseudomallei]|uniref:tetratricopeptide repeat protein n=1 Tax=Burkholderia pseudomallei TaxID=28450 RepID=UPI000978C6DC|nr:hypothetical protein [Burkholderia pseudomallei]OND90596.1 hypothetical protein AQ941_27750 [Burkholderia pseudomallei]ONE00888.1 hypothetical protein AQ942_01955 [Burkholderia pseudomallei]CAJ3085684.1 Putative Zn-dependent protease, contains TPR repeats [Burkholderia pseudomallei]CAJ3816002.1 Putative Zn-dependent protease, contains TPR repeats [Burkholderia pseudomallei]CAJ3820947.1 Putative Zn-dependent protease, contains TPR repeats [Burkholderia pseudomallei]
MLTESTGLQPPGNAQAFEDFCHIVYSKVLDDPLATKNGRSGQKQNGVDVFASRKGERYGVQCKQKTFGRLTTKIIDEEVKAADDGPVRIDKLVIATTVANDVKLIAHAAQLTDCRRKDGKFEVNLAFWDTLETLVRGNPELQYLFAPQMAGGAFWETRQRLDQHSAQVMQRFEQQSAQLDVLTTRFSSAYGGTLPAEALPDAREDSLNKLVDGQLDGVKQLLLSGRFNDALTSLATLGSSLDAFDSHQRARWFTQRAHCYWRKSEFALAVADFESANNLTPDDDKAISNRAMGELLVGNTERAMEIATDARARFPASVSVFTVWLQVVTGKGKQVQYPGDIPPEWRKNTDVLTVLGWLAAREGRNAEAAKLAKLACNQGFCSYEQTSLLLLALVNDAARDGVLVSLGLVPEKVKVDIEDAIGRFLPFEDTIWTRQDPTATPQTVACLGYALMMTGQPKQAEDLMREGAKRFPEDGQIARVCLECIRRNDSTLSDAFTFGRDRIDALDEQGRLMVAEMASHRGDSETISRIRAAMVRDGTDATYDEELRAFQWMAITNCGKGDKLESELSLETVTSMESVAAQVVALNVAFALSLPWTKQAVEALSARIDAQSSTGDVLMAARACLAVKMYDRTVELLKDTLPPRCISEPHKTLFEALIKSGNRQQARRMLDEFPPSAMEDADVRALAVELAQAANDWKQLLSLSDLQLKAHPDRAEAWAFRAAVLLRLQKTAEFRELLNRAVPVHLQGAIPAQVQLARLEIEAGNRGRGLARLYRIFRCALTDEKAATAYLQCYLLLNPDDVPAAPIHVGPATAVTLLDGVGQQRTVVIDPDEISDAPSASRFIHTRDAFYAPFAGKQLNDEVALPDGVGSERTYIITDIDSAYRYMASYAEKVNHEAVSQSRSLFSIQMPTDDEGQPDLSEVLEVLKARSARVRSAFEAYASGPATLGILGKILGVNAMAVAGDWPSAPSPKLYVCQGSVAEREASINLLRSWKGPLVIDLTALNELVANELEATLALVRPVYMSTSAVEVLNDFIATAESERSTGHMREDNGRISIIEYDETYHRQRLAYLRKMQRCVDDYCEVVPTWGNEVPPEKLHEISQHLGDDSYDALLLCLERNALLLTVDGRLREFGKVFGNIDGVWPQVFCSVAAERGLCGVQAYSKFVLWSIGRRRTHTSLSLQEFVWALNQPKEERQAAVQLILEYTAEPSIELSSMTKVVLDVAQHLLSVGATSAAVCMFLIRATAPLFSRKDANADDLENFLLFKLREFTTANFTRVTANPYEADAELGRVKVWLNRMSSALTLARNVAARETPAELAKKSLGVAPLYALRQPLYIGVKSDF